ncbi:hypothetical protein glysoja_037295, partial [Glycine soja]
QVVWFATIWTIWLFRNEVVFKHDNVEAEKVVETMKFKSWIWLSSKLGSFRYSVHEW